LAFLVVKSQSSYLYSIFPEVGSSITHRSFHFLSCLREDYNSSEIA
jgi:hypothetical protein